MCFLPPQIEDNIPIQYRINATNDIIPNDELRHSPLFLNNTIAPFIIFF